MLIQKSLILLLISYFLSVNFISDSMKDLYEIPISTQKFLDSEADCNGITAKQFGMTKLLLCLPNDYKQIFVVGENQPLKQYGCGDVLVSSVGPSDKIPSLIKKYPLSDPKSDYFAMSNDVTKELLSSFSINNTNSLQCLIFQYVFDYGGRQFEDSKSYVDFFVIDNGTLHEGKQMIQTGESRFAYTLIGNGFRYGEPDSEGRPGYISVGKILTLDENKDGFQDMVIWKKYYISRQIVDGETLSENQNKDYGPAFLQKDQQFFLMRFDPAKKYFESPIINPKISKPSDSIWELLPLVDTDLKIYGL